MRTSFKVIFAKFYIYGSYKQYTDTGIQKRKPKKQYAIAHLQTLANYKLKIIIVKL